VPLARTYLRPFVRSARAPAAPSAANTEKPGLVPTRRRSVRSKDPVRIAAIPTTAATDSPAASASKTARRSDSVPSPAAFLFDFPAVGRRATTVNFPLIEGDYPARTGGSTHSSASGPRSRPGCHPLAQRLTIRAFGPADSGDAHRSRDHAIATPRPPGRSRLSRSRERDASADTGAALRDWALNSLPESGRTRARAAVGSEVSASRVSGPTPDQRWVAVGVIGCAIVESEWSLLCQEAVAVCGFLGAG
jgi:hypothetical protein